MPEIKLPDMKQIVDDQEIMLLRKLTKSRRTAQMYLLICHYAAGKKFKFTTRDMVDKTGLNRGQIHMELTSLCSMGVIDAHKFGSTHDWIIQTSAIDQDHVDIAAETVRGKKK